MSSDLVIGPMVIEMSNCENTLLNEIGNTHFKRKDIAKTYRLAMQSSECQNNLIDWRKVNEAIVARWSFSALNWIKEQAWSGKCFQ
jgi:hypothetical protein